jgi:hypothetical protein
MAEIPGLPDELRVIPPAPYAPHDPDAQEKREAWMAWRDDVLRYRIQHQARVFANPQVYVPIERELCRRSCAYFVTMWGNLFEPRTGDPNRISGSFPWVPFERQVEYWEWRDERLAATGPDADGITEKARDMGASWSVCAWDAHKFLFADTFTALLVSRKEDLVDSKDSSSLFWKIRFLLRGLPDFLLPKGWDWKDKACSAQLSLINPENGNELLGESTNENAGRAVRATVMDFDEAAFIPGFESIWAGATNTTGHRFGTSSQSIDEGPGFFNLSRGIDMEFAPSAFPMYWFHNPQNDDQWYDDLKKRFANEPGKFEREVECNPRAGDDTYVYPMALELAVDLDAAYIDGCPLYIAMDPGFNDETAIIWIQEQGERFVVLDAYSKRNQPAAFYGCILTGYSQFLDVDKVEFPFPFDERDREIMRWTRTLPRTNIIGDAYGDNVSGATSDSIYDVLRKAPFRLKINADRTPTGDVSANQKIVRQFKGRREAMRRMLPHLAFAPTIGAKSVLRALQEHKFAEDTGKGVSVATRPLHDWTRHPVSAMEYWAATLESRRLINTASQRRSDRNAVKNAKHYSPKWSGAYSGTRTGPTPYKRRVA